MTDLAISVKKISKCYRVFDNFRSQLLNAFWPKYAKGLREVQSLSEINFEIGCGEAVAIIGRNGSGKSTLLEIITGTLLPSEGEVIVNGRVAALLELGSGFNPDYSGRDNVMLNGLLLGLSKEEILGRFNEILVFSEIGDAIDRPVKTYSSGMMMRLAFAVQILSNPDILIVDEALSVGDFFFQQKCLGYLYKLKKKNVTLIFVSHDMSTVRNLCSRTILLDKGMIAFDGNVDDGVSLYLNPSKRFDQQNNLEFYDSIKSNGGISSNFIQSPVWVCPCDLLEISKSKILEIGIYDKNWLPRTKFYIGDRVNFLVSFESFSRLPLHVGIVIKNKYDIVVNATTSYTLGAAPLNLEIGGSAQFELSIILNLEAGEYSFSFNLGVESGTVNQGEELFSTPELGPFNVSWDYGQDIAPFYGACGLPANAKFIKSD